MFLPMLQCNIFWSFGIGASLAICASEGIRKCDQAVVNKYFIYTALYLGGFFVPFTLFLLWEYPDWETNFQHEKSLHGIWVAYFAFTNLMSGLLGFYRVSYLIIEAEDMLIYKYWTVPITIMSAILSFGYDRLFYAGESI